MKKTSREEAKVLIVEDNLINIRVIRLLLEDFGITDIVIAENGKDAIKVFTDEFDLVYLDLGLPDIEGKLVFEELRKKVVNKYIPIMVCTSDGQAEETLRNMGADDYLIKPITMKCIESVLSRWFE